MNSSLYDNRYHLDSILLLSCSSARSLDIMLPGPIQQTHSHPSTIVNTPIPNKLGAFKLLGAEAVCVPMIPKDFLRFETHDVNWASASLALLAFAFVLGGNSHQSTQSSTRFTLLVPQQTDIAYSVTLSRGTIPTVRSEGIGRDSKPESAPGSHVLFAPRTMLACCVVAFGLECVYGV